MTNYYYGSEQQVLLMNEELFLRDDIIDLSNRMDSQNYNIKAYRKRNRSHTSRNNKNFLLSTQIIMSQIHEDNPIDKFTDKTPRTTEILSLKRLSVTSGVKKRSSAQDSQFPGFTRTARTKNNSAIEDPSVFQDNKNKPIINIKGLESKQGSKGKFSKQEKQFSKGGLKTKHLQNWLNQILLQYCHEQKFDATIENPALKKYGIDKNSLLSKGINSQNLQRIYKSLFVYSMGFNTLLKEIASKNMNIRKTFWKVYAILLEYCSDGDFDTMIGQIERDKVRKMEMLKEEIEKRQQVIENNEEINQQKNAKIFKELKLLRQENQNLENDKNVLMQDYKEAEQAFNEEVSLRLKFQNKINQIHGVHRQLSIKHQKLYDDLQSKNMENSSLKEKLSKVMEQCLSFKTDNQFLKKENKSFKQLNEFNFSLMDEMKQKVMSHEMLEVEWKHKKQQFSIVLREKEKRIEQTKGELRNCELMLEMKQKSEAELQKQYNRSLQQNKNLVSSLQKELEQINIYMVERKKFNDTHSRLYAEVQITNRHLKQKCQLLESQKKQVEKLKEERTGKDIEISLLKNKIGQNQADMEDLYLKISEMKKVKTIIQDELAQSRSREEYYQNYYADKQKLVSELTQKVEQNERQISQFNITKKTLDSKIILLSQKLQAEEESNKKKWQKSRLQMVSLDRQNKALKEERQERLNELQKATLLYEDTFNKLKDQLFERNDLQLRYNQSLSVVESETEHIKKLNIKISEMQERNEDISRKLKGIQFILENKEKAYQNEAIQHNIALLHLKDQIKGKKLFVHPMAYEDLRTQIERQEERLKHFKEQVQLQTKKANIPSMQANIKKMQNQLSQHRALHEREMQRKNEEIQIHRQKALQLQERMERRRDEGRQIEASPKNIFKEKERKYLDVIRQKTERVEHLLIEVEKAHDQNNQLIKRIDEAQNEIQQKDINLAAIQKQLSHFQSEKQALNLQKTYIIKEKEKLLAQIANQESRILDSEDRGRAYLDQQTNRDFKSQQKSNHIESHQRQSESRQKIQPGWRNDFSKKVKNAINYYKK